MMVFVKILDQPEFMKYLGLRSSEVKICYEVTSNDFGRLQWDFSSQESSTFSQNVQGMFPMLKTSSMTSMNISTQIFHSMFFTKNISFM